METNSTNNIYKKLQLARVELAALTIKKSGFNSFAKYAYFELSDYLPSVQVIFNTIGLCGVVRFTNDLASLTIFNTENTHEFIEFTSPMAEANLKGTHAIQNLGAVETYSTRYLWQTALEIVEHDALEPLTGAKPQQPPAAPPIDAAQGKPIDYAKLLSAAATLQALGQAWQKIPHELQPTYVALKDQLKAALLPHKQVA